MATARMGEESAYVDLLYSCSQAGGEHFTRCDTYILVDQICDRFVNLSVLSCLASRSALSRDYREDGNDQ